MIASEYIAPDCVGIDAPLSIIRQELQEIGWLRQAYQRLYPYRRDGEIIPAYHIGKGEYKHFTPTDEIAALMGLFPNDDEDIHESGYMATRTVSVIVCCDLRKIPGGHDMRTESLKGDVIGRLRELDCVMEFGEVVDQATSGNREVFAGFDTSGFEERYQTYPFAAFRIDVKVHYQLNPCW